MLSILLQFLILKNILAQENIGGVLWTFIQKNNLFLFDSLGLEGFKLFVVNHKEEMINQLLYNFSKCKLKLNQKLLLCSIKFCVETWEKMQQKTKNQLTDTAQKLFHLLEQFAKLKKKSLYEYIDTRKHCAKPDKSKLWKFTAIFL